MLERASNLVVFSEFIDYFLLTVVPKTTAQNVSFSVIISMWKKNHPVATCFFHGVDLSAVRFHQNCSYYNIARFQ